MKAIIKREFKNYIKNPILWIALAVILAGVYQQAGPYLALHYFQSEEEIQAAQAKIGDAEAAGDADILDGYIPASKEQQRDFGLQSIEKDLVKYSFLTEEQARRDIAEIQEKNLSIPEIEEYMEEEYGFFGVGNNFQLYENIPGTKEDTNAYISEKMKQHPFSWYAAMKFADFCGLFMGFAATVLLAFLYIRDTRKDMYELLHTKPVPPCAYIMGKAAGGLAVMLLLLVILNLVFGILCAVNGRRAGFPVDFLDFPRATVLYILPNMLMIVSIYTAAALLFRNPLPAVPLLFLYLIYSNMGGWGPDGEYGYYGRALAVMMRFPGGLFDCAPPPMWKMNQIFLILASAGLLAAGAVIWKRRRYY